MKIILGIGMVVTENRLKKLGFAEKEFLYDTKPKKVWVAGNHMTDTGSFADTIMYDPDKSRISVQYGGNISIPTYTLVGSTWDIKQFLKEHPIVDEKALHEEKYGRTYESYDVILMNHGTYKMGVIKELKLLFSLSLLESRKIVNSLPQIISTEAFRIDAETIKNKFQSIGAEVEIK
jgi:ribosomal protein L7/L12